MIEIGLANELPVLPVVQPACVYGTHGAYKLVCMVLVEQHRPTCLPLHFSAKALIQT